jgi:TPR repeat protein
LYSTGRGVALDYLEATMWRRRAAEQQYAPVETDLGHLYEQGKGVALDYVAAYVWYSIGATGGDHRAIPRIKALSQIMDQRQILEAKNKALSKILEAEESKTSSSKQPEKTPLFSRR